MMRGTWLVVMLVIVSMSMCQSARISVEAAKKMTAQEVEANDWDWKETACSWCAMTFSPRQCVRTCRRGLPGLTQEVEANDWEWKDTACSWCSFTPSPRQCVRTCRRGLPGMKKANGWRDVPCIFCPGAQDYESCSRTCVDY